MEDTSLEYVKLQPKKYPARSIRETAEGKFWKSFAYPAVVPQIGSITHVEFCEERPHHLAVTASSRVNVYDSSLKLIRTFSRFQDKAYSGTFRRDGRLLAAGGESGIVQVFDAGSRSVLRQLSGHSRPVHSVSFANDKLHVLSGGDDATVRTWDISTGEQVHRVSGHLDYVRTVAFSPMANDLYASGSYDHKCKLWDARSQTCVATMDHGAPIESLSFFPSESLLVSAGGTHLCCWDLMTGGRLLQKVVLHQKTITQVTVRKFEDNFDASAGLRILTSSLDGHVKVIDPLSFKLTFASKYPAALLGLAIAPDSRTLAVGMMDGMLTVRKRKKVSAAERQRYLDMSASSGKKKRYGGRLTAASFRYFIRGQSSKAAASDYVVASQRKVHLREYDRMLRKFRYQEALDAALDSQRPDVVAAVLEELANRGGLAAALEGRDRDSILPLMKHLSKWLTHPRHAQQLSSVCHKLLDGDLPSCLSRSNGEQKEEDRDALALQVMKLNDKLQCEVRLQEELMQIQGMLSALLSNSM